VVGTVGARPLVSGSSSAVTIRAREATHNMLPVARGAANVSWWRSAFASAGVCLPGMVTICFRLGWCLSGLDVTPPLPTPSDGPWPGRCAGPVCMAGPLAPSRPAHTAEHTLRVCRQTGNGLVMLRPWVRMRDDKFISEWGGTVRTPPTHTSDKHIRVVHAYIQVVHPSRGTRDPGTAGKRRVAGRAFQPSACIITLCTLFEPEVSSTQGRPVVSDVFIVTRIGSSISQEYGSHFSPLLKKKCCGSV
jgi:hypothetical protein